MCVTDRCRGVVVRECGYDPVGTMTQPVGMALFGMVWLLRVRSEMKRCAKCRRQDIVIAPEERTLASTSTFFTIDAPAPVPVTDTHSPGHSLGPTTYCEVHGFNPRKEDIQEFYELTLLDENKSVQEKTAETIRIANKWEANDGPIAPTYTNNDMDPYCEIELDLEEQSVLQLLDQIHMDEEKALKSLDEIRSDQEAGFIEVKNYPAAVLYKETSIDDLEPETKFSKHELIPRKESSVDHNMDETSCSIPERPCRRKEISIDNNESEYVPQRPARGKKETSIDYNEESLIQQVEKNKSKKKETCIDGDKTDEIQATSANVSVADANNLVRFFV